MRGVTVGNRGEVGGVDTVDERKENNKNVRMMPLIWSGVAPVFSIAEAMASSK